MPQSCRECSAVGLTIFLLGLCGCRGLGSEAPATPGDLKSIQHVVFMLQENRSFDSYFGMLNPYRESNGWNISEDGNIYTVDGIDDKLSNFANPDDEGQSFNLFKFKSSCVDDMSSAWLESYGDVNRYDFSINRPILMNGFVHTAEGFAKSGAGDGSFTDLVGKRAMGYYDQGLLNYYYYMASQFAVSDRWFSPVSSKSTPNRIATMTGGTMQGLVQDPFVNDRFTNQLNIETIFQELDQNSVSWKIYYSITEGGCTDVDGDCGPGGHSNDFPVTTFSDFSYSSQYLYANPQHVPCTPPTVGSQQAVGDSSNAFCIDPNHIAPLHQYLSDVANNALPSYAFIEAAYGSSDEHPGLGSVDSRRTAASFDHYQHPHAKSVLGEFGIFPQLRRTWWTIRSRPACAWTLERQYRQLSRSNSGYQHNRGESGQFEPCLPPGGTPTLHCDLQPADPGASPGDAPAQQGFAAQLGFRVPNLVISPFVRQHYVSHIPMDHTAIIKFVESRFINAGAHLTNRDLSQPDLLDFL